MENQESSFKIGIQAKLKHGALMAGLERRGWNQTQGAQFLGISNSVFGCWINMKEVPRHVSDELAKKLLELTGESPDELWPPEVFTPDFLNSPRTLKKIREIPAHLLALYGIIPPALPQGPDKAVEHEELKEAIRRALDQLKPSRKEVLQARYLQGMTLDEIANARGITRERVRQIESKALTELRHPSISRQLAKHV